MREQLKQIYRARLPDMGWCDDISQRKQQVRSNHIQASCTGLICTRTSSQRGGAVWCSAVWCGAVHCGVEQCGVMKCEILCHDELSNVAAAEVTGRPKLFKSPNFPQQSCRWRRHSAKCVGTG
jgi:hypothetical protein